MSVETKFYGRMTPEEMFAEKTTFGIDDVYLRHKWIKADCWAASKLYTYMDQLRLDKGLSFYSKRFNGQKALSDSTGYNKRFDLEISAYLGDDEMDKPVGRLFYSLTVQCKGCVLSNSIIQKTPTGPFESHRLTLESAVITQHMPEPVVDEPAYRYRRSKWDQGGGPYF